MTQIQLQTLFKQTVNMCALNCISWGTVNTRNDFVFYTVIVHAIKKEQQRTKTYNKYYNVLNEILC